VTNSDDPRAAFIEAACVPLDITRPRPTTTARDWHDYGGIKFLLEHGADPNRMTRWHHTALHQALRRDNATDRRMREKRRSEARGGVAFPSGYAEVDELLRSQGK